MPGSHLFNLGLFQKNFNSTSKVTGPAINIGCTRGRGSTTRMLNYCNQHSQNPSLCINQFVNINLDKIDPMLNNNLDSEIHKTIRHTNFTINPYSNSFGAIYHTSSNPSVASINGSIVTINGIGTTTITTTQESKGRYKKASVSSTLTVVNDPSAIKNAGTVNTTNPSYKYTIGSLGTGNGQFNGPCGIAIDSNGNIIVADTGNNRIQKFNSSRIYSNTYTAPLTPFFPYAVSINNSNGYAVADQGNNNILLFSNIGFQSQLQNNNGSQQIQTPQGVSYDGGQNLYVSTTGFIAGYPNYSINYSSSIQSVTNPGGVAIDPYGYIWVIDINNSTLVKLQPDPNGTILAIYGSQGNLNGQFNYPSGIAIDYAGNIIVADTGNNRIQIFDNNGNHLSTFGSPGSGNNNFNYPIGVAINQSGEILVADLGNNRVQIWG